MNTDRRLVKTFLASREDMLAGDPSLDSEVRDTVKRGNRLSINFVLRNGSRRIDGWASDSRVVIHPFAGRSEVVKGVSVDVPHQEILYSRVLTDVAGQLPQRRIRRDDIEIEIGEGDPASWLGTSFDWLVFASAEHVDGVRRVSVGVDADSTWTARFGAPDDTKLTFRSGTAVQAWNAIASTLMG